MAAVTVAVAVPSTIAAAHTQAQNQLLLCDKTVFTCCDGRKNNGQGRKRWFQDACDVDTCDEAASLANSARPLDVPVVVD